MPTPSRLQDFLLTVLVVERVQHRTRGRAKERIKEMLFNIQQEEKPLYGLIGMKMLALS